MMVGLLCYCLGTLGNWHVLLCAPPPELPSRSRTTSSSTQCNLGRPECNAFVHNTDFDPFNYQVDEGHRVSLHAFLLAPRLPAMSATSRPSPSPFEWAQHREVISRLYWDEDKTLKQVVGYMHTHHGFLATYVLIYACHLCLQYLANAPSDWTTCFLSDP